MNNTINNLFLKISNIDTYYVNLKCQTHNEITSSFHMSS